MQARSFIAIVLGGELVPERLKGGRIGRQPPGAQDALGIGLGALIIESMAHLVANDAADRTIVDGSIGVWIKERRLQYRRREDNLIESRGVVGIYLLRSHPPPITIGRQIDTLQFPVPFEKPGPDPIAESVISVHFKCGIIAPLVRVSDLWPKRG